MQKMKKLLLEKKTFSFNLKAERHLQLFSHSIIFIRSTNHTHWNKFSFETMSTCNGGSDLDFIDKCGSDGIKDTFLDGFIADMDLGECLHDVSLWPPVIHLTNGHCRCCCGHFSIADDVLIVSFRFRSRLTNLV